MNHFMLRIIKIKFKLLYYSYGEKKKYRHLLPKIFCIYSFILFSHIYNNICVSIIAI
ncbi:hypothetical protein PFFVO_03433 [Plasmodium falciparum Vietnam Oak-Knoll (FVO)]|uniref:Uncharacterized protein n=1 Tax=Plasmodium falciparum Vietnam Oak-Knoll (FVO) TaxID=1036723 RepID=A0A024V5P3_PLAFA|nr:hypothetical protein PFFVO_03433 [Plasmodium falciparum Vietnam Oak-Knoll (FVO)]